jgi:hypothetical protein
VAANNGYRIAVVAAGILFSIPVQANDSPWGFVGQAAIGQKGMELVIREQEFSPSFTTLDLSITAVKNKFYTSLAHERSIKDDIETDPTGLIFYSRLDTNLTFGYSLRENWNLFGGYRWGDTDMYYDDNVNQLSRSFGASSEGIFLGASYSHGFKKGTLSTSIAIASLKGEVSLTEPLVDTTAFTVITPPDVVEGDALGSSYSFVWTGEVSENTTYNLGLRIHRYTFDDKKVFAGLDLSYDENFTTISLGLSHFF